MNLPMQVRLIELAAALRTAVAIHRYGGSERLPRAVLDLISALAPEGPDAPPEFARLCRGRFGIKHIERALARFEEIT